MVGRPRGASTMELSATQSKNAEKDGRSQLWHRDLFEEEHPAHERQQRRITPLAAMSILWEDYIPVRINSKHREERWEHLSVRIAHGTQRHANSKAEVRCGGQEQLHKLTS